MVSGLNPSVHTGSQRDDLVERGRKVVGHQLVLDVVGQPQQEGVHLSRLVPLAPPSPDAEVNGVVRNGAGSLSETQEIPGSIGPSGCYTKHLAEFGGEGVEGGAGRRVAFPLGCSP